MKLIINGMGGNKKSCAVLIAVLVVCLTAFMVTHVCSYPLNAEASGIGRLIGFKPESGAKGASKQPPGALLSFQDIRLNLESTPATKWDFDNTPRNPELQKALEAMFKSRDPSYGVVVVDITDPQNLAWAGVREDISQMPGSVGKILTMLGFFSELSKAFPNIESRRKLLSARQVTAGEWVKWDEHKVPRYNAETNSVVKAVIQPGDQFTLAEWIDHMIASSANSAAATVWKETVLLRHFGAGYPPTLEQETQFFRETPKKSCGNLRQTLSVNR